MKKNIYQKALLVQLCLIVLFLLAMISCSKKSEVVVNPPSLNLSVSIDSLVFTESGGIKNVLVTTNGDNITALVPNTVSWVRCQVNGTTVTVTTDALSGAVSERIVDITISASKGSGIKQSSVRIIQRGAPVVINRDSVFVVPNSSRVVEGYLTLSQWYGYSYNDIDYSSVTHIDYSFMGPKSASDPTLVYNDMANEATALSHYSDLTDKTFLGYGDKLIAKAHAANVKVLIGIAGAPTLISILADNNLRAQFVANIVKLLEQRGYDGIALDYEYPASNSEGYNILMLMQDLRVAFVKSAVLTSKKMIITMAVPTGDWAAKYYNMAALSKCVDWFSPMTYEYSSATIANINSPLYKNATMGNSSATDDAVNYYLNARSVNPLQLTIGVPFYGSQYTGYTAMGAAATGTLRATKDMYNDFISKGGFTEMWDNSAQHSYYVNSSTNMMIVYDNEKDMATKGAYVKSKGLKGAMIWELSRGFYDMGTTKNPWLVALGNAVTK